MEAAESKDSKDLAQRVKETLGSLDHNAIALALEGKEGKDEATESALDSIVKTAEDYAQGHGLTCFEALDASLRTVLCDILLKAVSLEKDSTSEEVEESWQKIEVLLDATLLLFEREKVASDLFLHLLEDLAEEASLTLCEKLFQYVERKQPGVLAVSRNRLLLLKTCNKLLKRLSREDNPGMCGRLLILLAKLLPLSERSGVNLPGIFDTENTTDYMELKEGAKDESGKEIDVGLYNSMWKVQALLSNPPVVLETEKNWGEFQSSLKKVLGAFDETSMKHDKQDLSTNLYNFQSLKYSTSPNLLTLQLHDATFKCEYLLQVMMVLNQLKIEYPLKSTLHQSQADKVQKQKQLQELLKLETAVKESLKRFVPEDTFTLISTFIQREKQWILWKKVGSKEKGDEATEKSPQQKVKVKKCPPFERKPVQDDLKMFERQGTEGAVAKAPPAKRKRSSMIGFSKVQVSLGNEALDRLWNLSQDNYECLDFEDQEKVPRMSELVQRVVDQAQEDSQIENADKLMSDTLYSWRVKRLLAQDSRKEFLRHCDEDLEHLLPVVFPDLRDKMPSKKQDEKGEEGKEEGDSKVEDEKMEDAECKKEGKEEEEEGKVEDERMEDADCKKEEEKDASTLDAAPLD